MLGLEALIRPGDVLMHWDEGPPRRPPLPRVELDGVAWTVTSYREFELLEGVRARLHDRAPRRTGRWWS